MTTITHDVLAGASGFGRALDAAAKRLVDLAGASVMLLLLAPLFLAVAIAIKLDSPGPVFYRCRRVGHRGREIAMLKFRKMVDGAKGAPLTLAEDDRFTRIGRFLSKTKLDELPQLWNVLKGDMSLVGPRPEDPGIVAQRPELFERVLEVKPGMTGLCQLAFADESALLDPTDRIRHYLERLLPVKAEIDRMYAARRSTWMDCKILAWTALAVGLRVELSVDPRTGRVRRGQAPLLVEAAERV